MNRGGPLRQILALERGLQARGVGSVVVCGRVARGETDGSEDLRAAGIALERVPALRRALEPITDLRAYRSIGALLRRHRPDLVHTHLFKAGWLGRAAAHRARLPSVHTYHGHHFDRKGPARDAMRWMERALARISTRVIALTLSQASDVQAVLGLAASERVRVIAPGLDVAEFCRISAGFLPQRPHPRRAFALLYAGRLVPEKRLDVLLEALRRSSPGVCLTVTGSGPLRGALERRARALGPRVVFSGAVTHVGPWLRGHDAVVLSSEREGVPLILLEALALGRPVIATAVGGIGDVAAQIPGVFLVAANDPEALAVEIRRQAENRSPAVAGAELVDKHFGASRLTEETLALYEEILAGSASELAAPDTG